MRWERRLNQKCLKPSVDVEDITVTGIGQELEFGYSGLIKLPTGIENSDRIHRREIPSEVEPILSRHELPGYRAFWIPIPACERIAITCDGRNVLCVLIIVNLCDLRYPANHGAFGYKERGHPTRSYELKVYNNRDSLIVIVDIGD